MSSQVIPQGLLPTNQPDLFFEDNAVGRMKKEVWEASDAEIDAILADYGVPSPVEWGKPGSYIQTTIRWQVEANRKKNDIVFIPVGCTELHGQHLPSAIRHPLRQPDLRGRAALHRQARRAGQPGAAAAELRRPPVPPHGHARHGHRARARRARDDDRRDARPVERRLPQAAHRQQPRPAVDAGVGHAGVPEALPAPRHLPRHRLAPRRARVLPPHRARRQAGAPTSSMPTNRRPRWACCSTPRWWT